MEFGLIETAERNELVFGKEAILGLSCIVFYENSGTYKEKDTSV